MKKVLSILSSLIILIFIVGCSKSDDSDGDINIDDNASQTVTICNQVWAKTNLNVSHYRNGDVIPQVTDPVIWASLTTGAWCYYNNDQANEATYGKLYNWYAVNDSRGLAPTGWHVPTDAEWTTLTLNCLSDGKVPIGGTPGIPEGGYMKESGTMHWASPNSWATNSSGFTGLPGGYRYTDGTFANIGRTGSWWSSTKQTLTSGWFRRLGYDAGDVSRDTSRDNIGISVRCIKN